MESGNQVPGAVNGAEFRDFGSQTPAIDGSTIGFYSGFINDSTHNKGIFTYSNGTQNKIVFDQDTDPGGH